MSQTYQPNRRKRAKTHGFLVRTKTQNGRKVNTRRRRKGRANVSIKKYAPKEKAVKKGSFSCPNKGRKNSF